MLEIYVPETELYDERTNEFIHVKATTLHLEHSLLSISKWESKWCKPFLAKDKNDRRTSEEMLDYIRCMTIGSVPENVYTVLTKENIDQITEYINWPMTASTVTDHNTSSSSNSVITSELIYYWMIACNIPFSCEKWHINRLIMLIRICNAKNNPKKMSQKEILRNNRELNRARRKALHTRG